MMQIEEEDKSDYQYGNTNQVVDAPIIKGQLKYEVEELRTSQGANCMLGRSIRQSQKMFRTSQPDTCVDASVLVNQKYSMDNAYEDLGGVGVF